MARPDDICNPELRAALAATFGLMQAGNGTGAVKESAAAFLRFMEIYPAFRDASITVRGRTMPKMARWPSFGANLSLHGGAPRIDFVRERFSVAEAMTCYQFLLEEILEAERSRDS